VSSLLTRCRPSPCDRLSRSRTTTAAPPRPGLLGRQRTCPRSRWLRGFTGETKTVPMFTAFRLTGSVPSFAPTAYLRVRRRPSSWPPRPSTVAGMASPPSPHRRRLPQSQPISTRF